MVEAGKDRGKRVFTGGALRLMVGGVAATKMQWPPKSRAVWPITLGPTADIFRVLLLQVLNAKEEKLETGQY